MKTYVLYVTLHFRDLRSAAPRRVTETRRNYRSYGWTEPHQVWFSCRGKSYPASCEHLSDVTLHFTDQWGTVLLRYRNPRFGMGTEALSSTLFVPTQKNIRDGVNTALGRDLTSC